MELVAEFARGSIDEWNEKSWAERRMWVYFRILKNEKRVKGEERAMAEAKAKRAQQANMPKVTRDRAGVRS